ncbi:MULTISPECIES: RHS repeat-associated core domain-containing protein [Streptomyces]|uniref:Hint domain-containing protein n=1 Tax=Streptomyces venezuelae TaxID=54571 RepID=A0A5P2AVM6_STRVZ|nr:RHS repeat-associated core domain-containing protein [Streptomyces venezuelae]QES22342.1 hypothetical protein DEJ46_27260 [Streptomyces venezuelae]
MPPDPGNVEAGRETIEAEPLELEEIEPDKPVEGETFEKELETLKTEVPADQQQAPAGTTTPPPAETESFTFGSASVSPASYTAATTTEGSSLTQIPNLPIVAGKAEGYPAPTGTWQFSVVDRSAEISQGGEEALKVGSVVAVQAPATGSVPLTVGIKYSTFENLHGADWSTRLRLVQFPECYLTTPLEPACQEYEELETVNDPVTDTLTATVDTAADGTVTPAVATGSSPVSGSGVMQAAYTVTPAAASGDKTIIGTVDSGVGPGGSFRATPLASNGKWSAGGSSGAFTWSYPVAIPPAPAGPAPNIALSYNSQAVDGKTAVSSGQVSWVGEGWDYNPGFIERRYRTCKDDTRTLFSKTPNNTAKADKTSDLCWVSYNAVMSLGGTTTELVRDAAVDGKPETDTEVYRPLKDDGTRIERIVTADTNGDDNGEHWKVTTTDGTRYHFGLNKVGGGHAETNSVSTVPVFGNHPDEPCYATTFASSRCGAGKQQAWRWGLDKVEDVNGNVMVVNWNQETNYYAVRGQRKDGVKPEAYERAAYPVSIEYGMRAADLTKPSATVVFGTAQRCLKTTGCDAANFKPGNPTSYRPWWDTPGSLNCASGSKLCPGFPSFWTQLRLRTVTTNAARPGQTGLAKVDTYTLNHSFPEELYDTAPGLWLNSITRRGFAPGDTAGTLQSKDGVSFAPYTVGKRSPASLRKYLLDKQLPNLVASAPGDKRPDFTRPRIGTVATEAGADIEVEYIGGCQYEPATDKGEVNGPCFPVRWSPDGEDKSPKKAWFNRYVVHSVTETDKIANIFGKPVKTTYDYSGPAYSKNDDEFLRPALRTYSDWRGYRRVTVTKGDKTTPAKTAPLSTPPSQSRSTTLYFQGTGGAVKDSVDGTVLLADDAPQYAGMTAETLTFLNSDTSKTYFDNDPATKPAFKTRTRTFPDASVETASRARQAEDGTDLPALRAYRTGIKKTDSIQADGANWRGVRTTTLERDGYGLPTVGETAVVTHNGTGETLSQQTCTKTSYVHNTNAWLIGLPNKVRSTATSCANYTDPTPSNDLKGSVKIRYDHLAHGATPTKGLVTELDEVDGTGTDNDAGHFITTSSTDYDDLGRVTSVVTPSTGQAKTAYTPSTGGPVTSVKTTNAKGHASTTTFDPGRALALTVTDPNGRVTRSQYDALGRLVKGWSPSRSAGTQTPNVEISYQTAAVASNGLTNPAAVTVKTLKDDGGYARQVTLYDGLMRQVQTQSEAHGPGRIVTDTSYNDHGLVAEQANGYLVKGEPTTDLFKVKSATLVKYRVRTVYDGMERPVHQIPYHGQTRQDPTTTTYGDTSTLVDPAGSSVPATTTVTDALGRVTELRHHVASGKYRSTKYGYDKRGNRDTVTDTAGNAWRYLYDTRGRVTSVSDPDTGITQTQYDNADRPTTVTDALGQSIHTTYDTLGRVTAVREGSAGSTPVKAFTYDSNDVAQPNKAGWIGLLAESKRHTTTPAGADADYITKITGYDTEYRPTGRQVIIPVSPMTTGLSGTYTYGYTYTLTGKPLSVTLPAKGGLPAEKVITRYNEDGLPESTSGKAWYTSDVTYSPYGEVLRSVSSAQPYRVWTTNFVDEHTGRLMRTVTDREKAGPHRISDTGYAYDKAGVITASARQDAITNTTTTWDNQCFTYDVMGELVNAWTSNIKPTGAGVGCKAASGATWGYDSTGAPSSGPVVDAVSEASTTPGNLSQAAPYAGTVATSGVTGQAAYRQAFTYDWLGNRATMTEFDPEGVAAENVNYTYKYSASQPHTLTSVTSPTELATSYYTYNATGTTATRNPPGMAANQALAWTPEQKLASNTVGTNKTTYVYDAEGNRILENSPTGSTLYLGETELTTNGTAITSVSRAYSQAGTPTVVRTDGASGVHVLLTDHLGTAHTTVAATDNQPVTRRAFKPYGETRGTKVTDWPNKRSYLGVGIDDKSTLLTHIGAREYDQNTGRFISADPIIDIADPLQMNGYAYANNSPISHADPTGLFLDDFFEGAADAVKGAIHGTIDWASETAEGWNILTGDSDEAAKIRHDRENPGPGNGHTFLKNLFGKPEPNSSAYHTSYWLTQFMMPILPGAGMAISAAGKAATKAPAAGKAISKAASSTLSEGVEASAKKLPDCHSFLPKTEVLMADGTRKKIEDIEVGDIVATTEVETGKEADKKVLDTILTEDDKNFTKITLATGKTRSSIVATDTHPFWVPTLEEWVPAGSLSTGQWLRTNAGTLVQIAALDHYTKRQRTHDLTIEDIHAYYVFADATPVLVHNCSGGVAPNGQPCACNGSTDPSNLELIQAIATRAEAKVGGSGAVAGTKKHAYADKLLTRYQGIYGSRGLVTEQSYLNGAVVPHGTAGSARPDVYDPAEGIIYDYKFLLHPGRGIGQRQANLNARHVPGAWLTIEVNP